MLLRVIPVVFMFIINNFLFSLFKWLLLSSLFIFLFIDELKDGCGSLEGDQSNISKWVILFIHIGFCFIRIQSALLSSSSYF